MYQLNQYSHGIDKCIVSADFSQQTIITLLSRGECRAKSFSNYNNGWHATRPANTQLFPSTSGQIVSPDMHWYIRYKFCYDDKSRQICAKQIVEEWHVQNSDSRHPDSMFSIHASIKFKYVRPDAVSGMINLCVFALITREMGIFKPAYNVTWLLQIDKFVKSGVTKIKIWPNVEITIS